MFKPEAIQSLARTHSQTLRHLHRIEQALTRRFHRVEAPVRALLLSALAGEPLLFVGPPGTAKSRLIRAFCEAVGLQPSRAAQGGSADYFEYLLTPFTEPSELFGYYDIGRLQKGELARMNEGNMMQNARVVYLDEVFNGSSAILNTILSFLNERIFHDRGVPRKVAMESLFASTNQVPDTPELQAVYDRFLLRCPLHNIPASPEEVDQLLSAGWHDTYAAESEPPAPLDLLRELQAFRTDVSRQVHAGQLQPDPGSPFAQGLAHFIQTARQYDLCSMSNRRVIKLTHLLLLHRIYRVAIDPDNEPAELQGADLAIIPEFAFDRSDDEICSKLTAWAHRWRANDTPTQAAAPAAPPLPGPAEPSAQFRNPIPPPPLTPPDQR